MLAIQMSSTDISGLDCLRQQFHAAEDATMEHGAPRKKQATIKISNIGMGLKSVSSSFFKKHSINTNTHIHNRKP
jgi:hypothetical protein